MAKYHGATPTTGNVIEVHLLNFKPIFDRLPLKKIVRGTPVHGGGALVRLGHCLVRVKIWGCSTP